MLASGNAGKLAELGRLLGTTGCELIPQGELGVSGPPEDAVTFVENALLKARHAARETGLPALADDSGLCVARLDGAPGVRSARYAGDRASDADNIAKLLATMDGVPETERAAAFHCVIVALHTADDPAPLIVEGRWHGRIATAPRGQGGFGYDPVFLDPVLGMTAAELTSEQKNRVSHRAAASASLAEAWPRFAAAGGRVTAR